ncbi:MAG: hypothetical protein K8W52_06695 [Deltaproteobacteria bacterium]|nr:hypothetical protein [Deltaproteobacteria bacterium]
MISAPANWVRHHGANLVTLYPPGGGGRIRVFERVRPLMRMSAILGFVLERDPAFRLRSVRDATELTTAEGEHGAWVAVTGTRDDAASARFIGAVFGDDVALVVDALVAVPERAGLLEATARELVLGASLGLGTRRRRYRYQPPVGWRGLPSGLVTHWYPPGFPGDAASIAVAPAEPSTEDLSAVFDGMIASERARGHELDGRIVECALVTDHGLRGRHWACAVRGPQGVSQRELAAFVAAPYLYSLRLESGGAGQAAHREVFAAVARSVQAVPTPGGGHAGHAAPSSDLFGYLLD